LIFLIQVVLSFLHILRNVVNVVLKKEILSDFTKLSLFMTWEKDKKNRNKRVINGKMYD